MKFGSGGKTMTIKLMDDKQLWDKFIDNSPNGLLYHKWDFLKLIEKYTLYKLMSYGIYKGNTLISVFPLFYKNIKGLKCLFSPPPQSGVPYLGFVMNAAFFTDKQNKKEANLQLVAEDIHSEMKKFSPNYFSAVLTPGFSDIRPFKSLNYGINVNYTYTIDLRKSVEDIWSGFTVHCRQSIKQSQSMGLELVKSNDPSPLIEFLKERYQDQGMNFLVNPEYLGDLLRTYPDNISLYYVQENGQIISASMNHQYKNRFIMWFGIPKPQDPKYTNINEEIVWELIQKKKTEGCTTFEICGANQPQLCRFRSKYNPQLEPWFELHKKDVFGKLGEKAYLQFIKKI
jgi:hypothetical protein